MSRDKESKAVSVEIIDPIPEKGRGREYAARVYDWCKDCNQEWPVLPENELHLGLVVRGEDGKSLNAENVVVTVSDADQNAVIKGTGSVRKIIDENGGKEVVYYYPFT